MWALVRMVVITIQMQQVTHDFHDFETHLSRDLDSKAGLLRNCPLLALNGVEVKD